ncbi:MAG: hypothetical protein WCI67_19225, partial [Chloroflexales bacterium]
MQPPAEGRPPTRTGRGRAPARWTGWEVALIALSALMIAFPLYAEATRWIMPPLAPAQEISPSAAPTDVPPSAAPTDVPTAAGPSLNLVPTSTEIPLTSTPTTTGATPTNTPVPGAPTATPTRTNTPVPGAPTATSTRTSTPVPGNIRVFKVASVSDAAPGQQFSYSISVITTNTTDTPVTMSDSLSSSLSVIGVSATGGSCSSGQTVSCSLTISDVKPASVTIQVRVNSSTPSKTVISNVASAGGSDSSTVNVRVIGVAVSATITPGGPTLTPTAQGIVTATPTTTSASPN